MALAAQNRGPAEDSSQAQVEGHSTQWHPYPVPHNRSDSHIPDTNHSPRQRKADSTQRKGSLAAPPEGIPDNHRNQHSHRMHSTMQQRQRQQQELEACLQQPPWSMQQDSPVEELRAWPEHSTSEPKKQN